MAQFAEVPLAETKIPLSVLIRTLNEADRIAAAIKAALPLGAEIVVIDAGSTDATVEIATGLGARVHVNPWPGFGPQRHFGEDKCSNDFIFSLDADEIVRPELVSEIRDVFLSASPPRLMIVRKAVIFPHHAAPPPLGFCHEQILIYDRRIARTGPNPNWDKLEISAPDKPHRLGNPLWHYSWRDWNHVVAKANYVAGLAADTHERRSRAGLVLRLIFEFPLSFLKFYFVRRYCLGGIDGFTMAVTNAFGRFLRIAKMLERIDYGKK
jgi:glycosyltransferase involved in cell wall biosynthesis